MAVQAGDVLAFGRLAWDIYQYGFSEEANASKSYQEFGRDVRGLAQNLDILSTVLLQAGDTLHSQCGSGAVVRWDPYSLREIIGDYEGTLDECRRLLSSNQRYAIGSNPLRNIEWHVLVLPTAERLQQRIAMHNSKIQLFLKPFEIDLLYRVRQDIFRMHQDLANRINAVHHDLYRLIGVLVPDLEQELTQQAQRQVFLLDIPHDMADRFRFAALADRREYIDESSFALNDLSDAFVFNYDNSTRDFHGGILVADRTPPLEKYLNLMKCIWLFRRMQGSVPVDANNLDSHWPSYVRQLEDNLTHECTRFKRELVQPRIASSVGLSGDLFSIWPQREEAQLVDVVTRDELMEQVLEAPLESSVTTIERNVKLLRRMGTNGKKYRILISGSDQAGMGRARRQTETIDFDISSAIINPHYAMPRNAGLDHEVVLQRDERIARLSFTNLKDVLKFQQAVTGYKAWDSYCEYNVMVSFVVGGRKDPIFEEACVQLWIPKTMGGSLVSNTDMVSETASQNTAPSRSETLATTGSGSPDLHQSRRRGGSGTFADGPSRAPINIPQPPGRTATVFSTSWPRQSSPGPIGHSPPGRSPGMFPSTSPRKQTIPRRPVPMSVPTSQSNYPPRSGTMATYASNTQPMFSPVQGTPSSSGISIAPSNNTSTSSGNDSYTFTVSTGSNSTGFLHKPPQKPMLVLFTQSPSDGRASFVSIKIDEETSINPERCNCRRAGNDGLSCNVAAIERRKGDANLEAKRYSSSSDASDDWNLGRLALNNPSSSAGAWPELKRVSFMFQRPGARARFGGTPNKCQCKNLYQGELRSCLEQGHRGLWGEVQEFYRRQVNEYHRVRYEGHQQVVNTPMS